MKRTSFLLALLFVFGFLCPTMCLAQRGKGKDFEGDDFHSEIFLRPLKMVARTGGAAIYLVTDPEDCSGGDLLPTQRCFSVPTQPATLDWNEVAIESLTIPGKSLRDVVVLTLQHNLVFEFENDTNVDGTAIQRSRVTIILESPAFADVIDPFSGNPLNGQYAVKLPERRVRTTLRPGALHSDQISYSRRTFISRTLLKTTLAMTDAQVDQFFDNPITLRVSMDGRARFALDSSQQAWVFIEGY